MSELKHPAVDAGAVVAIAVHASDPMTGLGATTMLAADARVKVLADTDAARAEVIVVVEDDVDDGVLTSLREMRAESVLESPPRCVVVTERFRSDVLMAALECGMTALVKRSTVEGDELVRTVLAVNQGVAYLPPRLQGTLLRKLDRMQQDVLEPNGFTLSGLSARERDVLRMVAEGYGTDEIATALAYSESTVKNVLHGMMSRCGLNNRAHAVAFAMRSGAI
ncbi:helix-turn-helix transcriptional regulator [Amycolatopsis sp. CA-230715]|uniref:helix-turn-helix transcriptional regulator n=1 Tax=Amycolatopsis sp. CA-230715 TaxID=2745196 RepID=UPI002F40B425